MKEEGRRIGEKGKGGHLSQMTDAGSAI